MATENEGLLKAVEPFAISTASLRDLFPLRHIEQVCFPKDAWPLLDLVGVLTFPDIQRLKAVVGEQMVGFIAGDVRRSEGVGWITTLGVLPEYRRQGIAAALLATCEERMKVPFVKLSVRRSNAPAIALYRRFGYQQSGVWPRYYSGGEDALVLEKRM